MSRTWIYATAAAALVMSGLAGAAAGGFELLSPREYQSELAARSLPGAHFARRSAELGAPTITEVALMRPPPMRSRMARFTAGEMP